MLFVSSLVCLLDSCFVGVLSLPPCITVGYELNRENHILALQADQEIMEEALKSHLIEIAVHGLLGRGYGSIAPIQDLGRTSQQCNKDN